MSLNVSSCNLTKLDTANFPIIENINVGECPISQLDVSENHKLRSLDITGTQIANLDVSSCPDINVIILSPNDPPIRGDQAAMISFANSLPDRTGKDAGLLVLHHTYDWIQDICNAKNWTME